MQLLTTLLRACTAAFFCAAASTAFAQADYPSRTIELIIPAAPGGLMDNVARTLSQQLNQSIGATVVVRNESAGSGIAAATAVANAKPDGYTLGLVQGSQLTMLPHFVKTTWKLDDIEPVTLMYRLPVVLAVNKSVPANNVKELVDLVRKEGKPLQAGTTAQGGLAHLLLELFGASAKIPVQGIPFRGEAPMILAMRSDTIQAGITTVNSVKQHADAGAMRILATSGPRRASILPDVPTFGEAGFPDVQATSWHGIVVPKGTPRPIIDKLQKAIVAALATEAIKSRLTPDLDVMASTPEQFGKIIRDENKLWGDLIKARGITQ
jgi:tripartite-type tricarboxylate transporter receptor subunit TctC